MLGFASQLPKISFNKWRDIKLYHERLTQNVCASLKIIFDNLNVAFKLTIEKINKIVKGIAFQGKQKIGLVMKSSLKIKAILE